MNPTIRKAFVLEIIAHDSDQWIELRQPRKAGERHFFLRLKPRPPFRGVLPRGWFQRQYTLHLATGVVRPFPPQIGEGL